MSRKLLRENRVYIYTVLEMPQKPQKNCVFKVCKKRLRLNCIGFRLYLHSLRGSYYEIWLRKSKFYRTGFRCSN